MIKTHIKFLLFFALLLSGTTLFSQVQFNMLSDYGTPIMDINSSGQGISLSGYYDFATNAITAAETGVIRTSSMNDNGDVFGLIEDSNGNPIGAVRKNGIWTPLSAQLHWVKKMNCMIFLKMENGSLVNWDGLWN